MDKKQLDPQLDESVTGMAPKGIGDTQATETNEIDDQLMGNGDRGPLSGNGDR